MARELKPCPFCGEQAITLDRRNGTWIVACLRIECPAKIVGPSKQAVMTAWNRRAEVSEGPTTAGPMPKVSEEDVAWFKRTLYAHAEDRAVGELDASSASVILALLEWAAGNGGKR